MYRYIVIQPDGNEESWLEDKAPDWKTIQKHTEGIFQVPPYFSSLMYHGKKYNRGTAYVNEEGFMRGLEYNERATDAWIKACPKGDPARMKLCGPLLFVAKEKP